MAIQSVAEAGMSNNCLEQSQSIVLCGTCRGIYPATGKRIHHAFRCVKTIEQNHEFVPLIDEFFRHKIPNEKEFLSVVFPFRYKECTVIKELKIGYNPLQNCEKRMLIDFRALKDFFKLELHELILSKFPHERAQRVDVEVIRKNSDLLFLIGKALDKRKYFKTSCHLAAYFQYPDEGDSMIMRRIEIHYQIADPKMLIIDASHVIGLDHHLANEMMDSVSFVINSNEHYEKIMIWGIDKEEDLLPFVQAWMDRLVISHDDTTKNFYLRMRNNPSHIYRLGIRYYLENSQVKKLLIDLPEKIRADATLSNRLFQLISEKFGIEESSNKGFVISENEQLFPLIEELLDGISLIVELDKTVIFLYVNEVSDQDLAKRYVRIKYNPGEMFQRNSKTLIVDINNAIGIDKSYSAKVNGLVKNKLGLHPMSVLFSSQRIVRRFREAPEKASVAVQTISHKLRETKMISSQSPNKQLLSMVDEYLKKKTLTELVSAACSKKVFYFRYHDEEENPREGFFTMQFEPKDQCLTLNFSEVEYDEDLLALLRLVTLKLKPELLRLFYREECLVFTKEELEEL